MTVGSYYIKPVWICHILYGDINWKPKPDARQAWRPYIYA